MKYYKMNVMFLLRIKTMSIKGNKVLKKMKTRYQVQFGEDINTVFFVALFITEKIVLKVCKCKFFKNECSVSSGNQYNVD